MVAGRGSSTLELEVGALVVVGRIIAAAAFSHSDQHPSFSSCFLFPSSRSEPGNDGY